MNDKNAKHTPGPWVEMRKSDNFGDTEDGFSIKAHGGDMYHVCRIWRDCPNWEANARLIAAAPELLEGAKWALAVIENFRGAVRGEVMSDTALAKLRAAIAKAEGRQL